MKPLLTVLLLGGMMFGQDQAVTVAEGQVPLSPRKAATIIFYLGSTIDGSGDLALHCEQMNPEPKDCELLNGKSMDDFVNVVIKMARHNSAETEGLMRERDDLQKLLRAWQESTPRKKKP